MIRVAAIQRCSAGTPEFNVDESVKMAREAAKKFPGLDMIQFPEDNAGFEPTPAEALATAQTIDGPYISAMRELAKELKININSGSFTEKTDEGKTRNTLAIINRDGEIIDTYSKTHLADNWGFKESSYVGAGDKLKVIETDFAKLGVMICYDMRFPELARTLALKGADILCVSSLWPCGAPLPSRTDHWDVLVRANAIQNMMYVVSANQYGANGGEMPFGRSSIVDPWGMVIAQASAGNQIICADIDLEYQAQVRRSMACLENRRPDLYELG